MKYKLSQKRGEKWWTYGSFAPNKWGNLQASFKVTPELIELINANAGKWINFAAFEDKPTQHSVDKGSGYQPDDDMPPF